MTSGGARQGATTSTIRGTAEGIVTLPYQLGYRPERSLVMVCLDTVPTGARGKATGTVSLVARADLDPDDAGPAEVMAALRVALHRADPDVVLLFAFEGPLDDGTGLLEDAQRVAEEAGAVVDRAVRVREGRWRALVDPDGSSPQWRDLPDPADVPAVADYVLRGCSPLEDRGAMAALFEPARPVVAAATRHLLATACREDQPCDAERAMGLLAQTLAAEGEDLPHLVPEVLADLALLLHDVLVRDAVLARLAPGIMRLQDVPHDHAALVRRSLPTGPVDATACRRLVRLASVVPVEVAAPVITVCGYLAWCAGEGTLANLAVERALRHDPTYTLARLLDGALQHAVPPPSRAARRGSGRDRRPPAA